MSIIQWNCRGIASSSEQIKTLFRDTDAKILCLQETKIGNKPFNPGLSYNFHGSTPLPAARAQGGTGFIIHKSINFIPIQLHTDLQACAVQVHIDKKVTLCSLYLEPKLEDHLFDVAGDSRPLEITDLQNLVDQLPSPFILMGDFNAKHTLWGESMCDRWGILIEQLLDTNDIVLMNDGQPTRYDIFHNSSSAIDLSLCSSSIRLDYNWSVNKDLYGSDHWPIMLHSSHNIPSPCQPKWKIEEADWKSYENATEIDRNVNDFPSPVHAYQHLTNKILDSADKFIPRTVGMPRRPVVPWWNKDCKVARKVTRTCFRRYLRSPCEANKIAYARARAKQKRIFKKAKRLSWRKYISEISAKTPSSQIWKKIRKLQGKYTPNPTPVLKDGDRYISDTKGVAELLAKHFASISSAAHYSQEFQAIRSSTVIVPPISSNTESFNLPFSMKEMQNALSSSSLTSPGEDDIRYEMLHHLKGITKEFLLNILNGLWSSNTSPDSWHTSIVVPGLKPGKDSELPQSYRPIALTSCVCKLYERMVNNRLIWYLESKNLLSNRQFGFRKNRSTLDPMLMLSREIQNAFANQNQVVGVFFDLEKAYDTTWRDGILKQLASWGVGGNMFSCIKDFLSKRYIKVRIGSELSSPYLQEEGVPQGSVLSVTLFAVAINSLMASLPHGVQGSLFVDDFAVYCSGPNAAQACRNIQTAINAASTWAKTRGFKFSPLKTKAIRFCRTRKREEIPTLFLDNTILPYEDEVKFLGVIFDKKLTFGPHIHDLCYRAKLSMNILKVVSNFDWGADRETLLRLYKSLCLSKLDYACQIYGSACKTLLEKLDVVHNLGLRICTGAYRTSPVASLYVDSGLPPLSIRREELSLRYITKTLTSKNNPNYKYVKSPLNRAVNKPRMPKPLEVRLEKESREVGILSRPIGQIGCPESPPWCNPSSGVCLIAGGKKSNSNEALKKEFLKHSSEHRGQITLYTDGSKTPNGVGSAVVAGDVVIRKRLPSSCSIFTAEMYAILQAVKHVFNIGNYGEVFIIYTDSNAVLLSLEKLFSFHHLVQEVQEWLVLLHSRKRITVNFCWVPAHVGIKGNEKADKAAKEAALLLNITPITIPYSDFKEIIYLFIRDKWQAIWNNLDNNCKLKEIRPCVQKWHSSNQPNRRTSIVLTRLRIGHTHATHSFLMKSGEGRQAPVCNACQCILNVKHILVDCPTFTLERQVTLLHGRSISEILGDGCNVDKLMLFLKKIRLYHKL